MSKKLLVLVVGLAIIGVGVIYFSPTKNKKVYHVGVLSGVNVFAAAVDGFKAQMTKLGYIDGKNIIYDLQSLNADSAGSKKAIDKFVADRVDLIFVFPTEPSVYAKTATKASGIPVVFIGDIEGSNLVDSIQSPGGNVTGIRTGAPEGTAKRLEYLHQIDPSARKVYLPYDKNYPITPATLALVRQRASILGITLIEASVSSPAEFLADLKKRDQTNVAFDAMLTMPNPVLGIPPSWQAIKAFGTKHKLTIVGSTPNQAEEGGAILTLFPQTPIMGQMAATLADKIFRGTPPKLIPVETAQPYFIVNYKQIQALGLKISEGLLSQADQIIH